jgi:hypothetical protein
VPRLGALYMTMEPKLRQLPTRRALTEGDIITPAFRLEHDRRLEIYYAPLDWLRPTARLAVVGITPGKATMLLAYQTMVNGLASGRSASSVLNDVKAAAPFSGFRARLVQWLDYVGVHRHLGLESADQLWTAEGRRYFHPTSALRYPVFVGGKNYSGAAPSLTHNPILSQYIDRELGPELAKIPDALVVPLGLRVDEAIGRLIQAGALDSARCLVGFPHPSGSNGAKTQQWTDNKSKLKRKVTDWFREHPVH